VLAVVFVAVSADNVICAGVVLRGPRMCGRHGWHGGRSIRCTALLGNYGPTGGRLFLERGQSPLFFCWLPLQAVCEAASATRSEKKKRTHRSSHQHTPCSPSPPVPASASQCQPVPVSGRVRVWPVHRSQHPSIHQHSRPALPPFLPSLPS
jgi:hypothetical protein